MKNFIQRAITGILFVAILVGGMLYSPLTFGVLFMLITALSVWEFAQLVNRREDVTINPVITTLGGVYLFIAIFSYCTEATDARIFIPYLLILIYLFVSELYLKRLNPMNVERTRFPSQHRDERQFAHQFQCYSATFSLYIQLE